MLECYYQLSKLVCKSFPTLDHICSVYSIFYSNINQNSMGNPVAGQLQMKYFTLQVLLLCFYYLKRLFESILDIWHACVMEDTQKIDGKIIVIKFKHNSMKVSEAYYY